LKNNIEKALMSLFLLAIVAISGAFLDVQLLKADVEDTKQDTKEMANDIKILVKDVQFIKGKFE
jgi:hypothetical protein